MKTRLILLLTVIGLLVPAATANAAPPTRPSLVPRLRPGWSWPVSPVHIDRDFAAPRQRWLPGHRGIDLTARPGQPVRAPVTGVVTFNARVSDRPLVTIRTNAGLLVSVEPVASTAARGSWVETGAALGEVSAGGHCDQRCVHLGVRRERSYLDPLAVALRRAPILLPLESSERPPDFGYLAEQATWQISGRGFSRAGRA